MGRWKWVWKKRRAGCRPHNSGKGFYVCGISVGGNESIEGARGGGRIRHTSRFSRQTHLNSPTVTKYASKNKAIQANSPKMPPGFKRLTWVQFIFIFKHHFNTLHCSINKNSRGAKGCYVIPSAW